MNEEYIDEIQMYNDEIETLIKADSSIIEIISYEWQRVHGFINTIANKLDKEWLCWSTILGLRRYNKREGTYQTEKDCDEIGVLEYFFNSEEEIILILEDFHPYIDRNSSTYDIDIVRYLREISRDSNDKHLILFQPIKVIPSELSKEIGLVEIGLPGRDTIRTIVEDVVLKKYSVEKEEITDKLLEAALGLTIMEAELAFSKAIIMEGMLTENEIPIIINEKEKIIKQDGLLEYYHPKDTLKNIGGLDNLKDWIRKRRGAYSQIARDFGLSIPKGILLLGIPGCGKSLTAKAVAKDWNFPLLRFDLGKVFGGIVGESEKNIRRALDIAKTISPCVLWIDEIEKGFSGVSSSGATDGGTTSRIFGTFLTWMQEKEEPVFVVATANDISLLPAELLRKGRFDEIFFVDLPSKKDRKSIFSIHLEKKGRDPEDFNLDVLVDRTDNFSGAEIEEIINDSLFLAFDCEKELGDEHILQAINNITPLSTTMAEMIENLRNWAGSRARYAGKSREYNLNKGGKVPKLKQEVNNPFI